MASIQEAQQARTVLEQKIADVLHQFSIETGLLVTYVNVDHATILGQAPKYVVQVEAKL